MKNNENQKLKAYLLYVYGRVQRVGFRRYVLDLAQDFGLTGYVKNLPDGSVEILVQGEEVRLSNFLDRIRKPQWGTVKDVKIRETTVNPEIKNFKIIYGEIQEELHEGFGAMQEIFTQYWKELREYRQEFRDFRREFQQEFGSFRQEFRNFAKETQENFKTVLEKYGEISEKLTTILETLVKESKETRKMLNETMNLLKRAVEKLTEK